MKEWMNGSKHSHHMHFPIHINDTNNMANTERLFTRWGMKIFLMVSRDMGGNND
jgi:hypothetical protein